MRMANGDAANAPLREMMERQVGHLIRLVDDLLEVSRISRGVFELRRERVEVSVVVRNAVETSEPLIRSAGHELLVSLPKEQLWLDGDPVRLAQILANLLNNAANYTPSGGRIELCARREGSKVTIAVRDNDTGIAPEVAALVRDVQPRQSLATARPGRARNRARPGAGARRDARGEPSVRRAAVRARAASLP
jgi:signal transduction histidine kinase